MIKAPDKSLAAWAIEIIRERLKHCFVEVTLLKNGNPQWTNSLDPSRKVWTSLFAGHQAQVESQVSSHDPITVNIKLTALTPMEIDGAQVRIFENNEVVAERIITLPFLYLKEGDCIHLDYNLNLSYTSEGDVEVVS